jgi:hypothetical protein
MITKLNNKALCDYYLSKYMDDSNTHFMQYLYGIKFSEVMAKNNTFSIDEQVLRDYIDALNDGEITTREYNILVRKYKAIYKSVRRN